MEYLYMSNCDFFESKENLNASNSIQSPSKKMNVKTSYIHLRGKPTQDLTKTKLCENYIKGLCYDSKCKWAHGRHELRSTENFYKTSLCKYWLNSICYAGESCRHAHGEAELREPKVPARVCLQNNKTRHSHLNTGNPDISPSNFLNFERNVEGSKLNLNLQQFSGKTTKLKTSDRMIETRPLGCDWSHGSINKFNDCASTVPPTVAGDSSYSTPQGYVASHSDKEIKPVEVSENVQSLKQVESILKNIQETHEATRERSADVSTIPYWRSAHDTDGVRRYTVPTCSHINFDKKNVALLEKSRAYQETEPEFFLSFYSHDYDLPINTSFNHSPDYRRYTVHDVLKLDSKEHLDSFNHSNRQRAVKNQFCNECLPALNRFDSLHFDKLLSDVNPFEIENNKKNTELVFDPFQSSMSFLHPSDYCDSKEVNENKTERNSVAICLTENDTEKNANILPVCEKSFPEVNLINYLDYWPSVRGSGATNQLFQNLSKKSSEKHLTHLNYEQDPNLHSFGNSAKWSSLNDQMFSSRLNNNADLGDPLFPMELCDIRRKKRHTLPAINFDNLPDISFFEKIWKERPI
ncbi:uncharacterized protein LOC128883028 isoform X2 [Hylaeus volcanicus]|uniref:uncharacterized protein LOC128883028 isoform X2 n=1 Tax=Hylaeus volcanicus TaxID=313075 RepID=UPI0023B78A1A|nr:uncharacterized protein LOC128883028 isoform X2 [Hylaeus volcanicus]